MFLKKEKQMENKLIKTYKEKRVELDNAEEEMNEHFEKIVNTMLTSVKIKNDCTVIKERLRVMPECASKVLLFRKIILTEQKLGKV